MKFKPSSILFALAFIVSACASAPGVPTTSVEDMQSTSMALAFTYVAETHAALPTNTPVPPTGTPIPTFTLEPSLTVEPTLSPTVEAPTFTAQPAGSSNNPCNQPLTSWNVPTASFTIVNETRPQGKILLLVSVITGHGECGWLPIYSDSFTGPVGNYSATAFVDGQKSFKLYASFKIQHGSWKIIVRNDRLVALGSCYPNC